MDETKICKKCGRLLPIENFRLCKGQFGNPYYRGYCKECEGEYFREHNDNKRAKQFTFSEELEIVTQRKFKEIHKERILDISETCLEITLLGEDEIFVKLMDYKDAWLSNYGRLIRCSYGKYNLLRGRYLNVTAVKKHRMVHNCADHVRVTADRQINGAVRRKRDHTKILFEADDHFFRQG